MRLSPEEAFVEDRVNECGNYYGREGFICGQGSGKPNTTPKGKRGKNFLFRFLPMAANKIQM